MYMLLHCKDLHEGHCNERHEYKCILGNSKAFSGRSKTSELEVNKYILGKHATSLFHHISYSTKFIQYKVFVSVVKKINIKGNCRTI